LRKLLNNGAVRPCANSDDMFRRFDTTRACIRSISAAHTYTTLQEEVGYC